MSEGDYSGNPSELAQNIDDSSSRLTETYQGDGTTNEPIIEYLEEDESVRYILTAYGKSIAVNDKGSGEKLPEDGKPTYVLTESRILGIMPYKEGDQRYQIPFDSVLDVKNHFGWLNTRWRMEIKTTNHSYHLWIAPTDNQKETVNDAKDYILEKADKKERESSSASDNVDEGETEINNSQESQQSPIDTDNLDPEYSFTAKKKGMKIEEDGETHHLTSKKGSKSKFEFTDGQFIATIPQESDDEIFVVDYESIEDIEFSSSLRKNRIDIHTENRVYKFWTRDSLNSNELMEFISDVSSFEKEQERAKKLSEQAKGSIKTKRLVKTSGLTQTYLYDKPLIDYIGENEQPHYVFRGASNCPLLITYPGSKKADKNKQNYAYLLITDIRILYIAGQKGGDKVLQVQYDDLKNVEGKKHTSGFQQIRFEDRNEKRYTFRFLDSERNEACEYINNRIDKNASTYEEATGSPNKGRTGNLDETKRESSEQNRHLNDIRSELTEVDSLITDAEYAKAEQLLEDIRSQCSSLVAELSQQDSSNLDFEARKIESELENRLSKSNVLNLIRKMDPYEFEEFVAKIWRKQGWDAEVTSGSADRGVDVVATKEDAFETRRHLIQVKRHGENTKVGSEDIQRYAGLYARRDETPDAVFVVTSNHFTKEAEEVAKNRDVRLVDCNELYNRLAET